MKSLFKLAIYLKKYTAQIILVLMMLLGSGLADLYLPALMAEIVDQGVVKGDRLFIYRTGLTMLLVAAGGVLCALISSFNTARIAMGFSRRLRLALFSRVEHYSLDSFDQIGTSSLITRTTNDVKQVQHTVIMMMGIMVRAPIMGIGGIVMALLHDGQLAIVFFMAIPVLAFTLFMIASRGIPLYRQMQKKLDRLNLIIREKLVGLRVIRAFDRVDYEKRRFDEGNRELTGTGLKLAGLMTLLMPLMMIIMNLTIIAIVWFGSLRAEGGHMMVGDIMAFIQYAMQILFSLMMISMLFVMIPRAQVSAGRINEVLDIEPEAEAEVSDCPKSQDALVCFDHVYFTYHGAEKPALRDISFTLNRGETAAVIGSTGSGKTTLVNLLSGFYDADQGLITVEGINIETVNRQALRQRIGLVPQQATLFTGSIRDNLQFGRPDAGDNELWHAVECAQAGKFVADLEGGLNALLEQGGKNLSGGQKQRLAIARALVRRPDLYLFDDSFSALDYKTDAALRKALEKEIRHAAVLIVAQRVTTILHADKIIVLDEGRIAGMGNHQALMSSCEVYREIVYSQLSQEELA